MQCVTPMFREYQLGDRKSGKIIPRSTVYNELKLNPNHIREELKRWNTISTQKIQLIPCGKCWACQLNYSAEWATRIMLEAKGDENCYFLTLTYDDEHVPVSEETGQLSLDPRDVTLFIKSLREHLRKQGHTNLKYFYCGEYGETTKRPHYHMILMHCPLDITQFYNTHIDGQFHEHWKSKELEKWWEHGIHDIGTLEWSTAAYVARYCTKKIFKDQEQYIKAGINKEFVRMSQGIGFEYYERHKDEIYKNDEMIMKTIKGNTGRYKPPKAFDRKYKKENPLNYQAIKAKRNIAAERSRDITEDLCDYTDLDMLEHEVESILTKAKMLPREGNIEIGALN